MTALLNDPQWQAFLAAIRANLADDTVRLVAADFLDENAGDMECEQCKGEGDELVRSEERGGLKGGSWSPCPRCSHSGRVSKGFAEYAEFVRVQCELSKMPWMGMKASDPRYLLPPPWEAIRLREKELWSSITLTSVPSFSKCIENPKAEVEIGSIRGSLKGNPLVFRRGFIEEARCPMATWLEHGPKIVRLPTAAVRKVVVTDRSPYRWASDSGSIRYFWINTDKQGRTYPDRQASHIPGEIFAELERLKGAVIVLKEYARYDSVELAHAALSDACLSWAWASEPAVNV